MPERKIPVAFDAARHNARMRAPSPELLAQLGVRTLRPLGGRMNHHWLVEGSGGRAVLRRWAEQPPASIDYEIGLVEHVARLGWPVAVLTPPCAHEGRLWSLAPLLPGSPRPEEAAEARRARGRLLAEFHLSLKGRGAMAQRPGWRRTEEILADPSIDRLLAAHEAARPEEIRILRWHLDRARTLWEELGGERGPIAPVHGDFTSWNLLYVGETLTGIIDFELSREDHRCADFALAWRGKHDEVVEGYEEVWPLDPEERAAIVPIWWASLIEGACRDLRRGTMDDGWTLAKLLARSPLMGSAAEPAPF